MKRLLVGFIAAIALVSFVTIGEAKKGKVDKECIKKCNDEGKSCRKEAKDKASKKECKKSNKDCKKGCSEKKAAPKDEGGK
jgi:hypothetical protein